MRETTLVEEDRDCENALARGEVKAESNGAEESVASERAVDGADDGTFNGASSWDSRRSDVEETLFVRDGESVGDDDSL